MLRACVLSHVQLFATLWTVAYQAPLTMEFSREEYEVKWALESITTKKLVEVMEFQLSYSKS